MDTYKITVTARQHKIILTALTYVLDNFEKVTKGSIPDMSLHEVFKIKQAVGNPRPEEPAPPTSPPKPTAVEWGGDDEGDEEDERALMRQRQAERRARMTPEEAAADRAKSRERERRKRQEEREFNKAFNESLGRPGAQVPDRRRRSR